MKYDRQRLLHRRQFVLGPHFVEELSSWKRLSVRPGLCLTAHPDLALHQVRDDIRSITLLGFILDPRNPEADDAAILRSLFDDLKSCGTVDSFFPVTDYLGGCWALIVDDGRNIVMFQDPVGSRQIVYATEGSGQEAKVWCGTQPGLLTKVMELTLDDEVMQYVAFTSAQNAEYWWPGDRTRYRGVRQLLPNHYLDLSKGTVHRHWPRTARGHLGLEECTVSCSQILQNMMKSACNRFDVRLQMTAGFDSRVVMAASRQLKDKLDGFTMLPEDLRWRSPDVQIASRLAARMQLPQHFVVKPHRPNAEFREICQASVSDPHTAFQSRMICHTIPPLDGQRVSAGGTGSEIARCILASMIPEKTVYETADDIISVLPLDNLPRSEFVTAEVDRWLSDLGDLLGYHVLDLFYWENRLGRWMASAYTEFGIVHEGFSPYNCRELLLQMLAVDEKYRRPPACILHVALINKMWPLLLEEPINPSPIPRLTTQIVAAGLFLARSSLRRVGLLGAARKIKRAIFSLAGVGAR